MIDFGFGVNTPRGVDMDKNDLDMAREIFDRLPD